VESLARSNSALGGPALRVLLVPSAYYPHIGGIEEITRRVALRLRELGHEPLIVVNRWPHDAPARENLDGICIRRLRFELPALAPVPGTRFLVHFPRAVASLVVTVRTFRPDVVHVIGAGPNAVYVAAVRGALGAPVVVTTQGETRNDAHAVFDRSVSMRTGLRALLRTAAVITAPTCFTLRELTEAYRVRSRCEIVPNGVAISELTTAVPEEADTRYVLATGRLVPQKAFDVLLTAWAEAQPQLQGWRLWIVGDGPLRVDLEEQAVSLGLRHHVRFLGAVGHARVASLLRGAELFVLSSRQEALPLALFEAMAAGTPAVTTNAGGIGEYVRDGENALLVPANDAASLRDAILRVARDSELRERLRLAARETAESLSWERVTARYLELYRELMS
jgi:glycosyltransferase involved in cell wall biosynthesis